MEKERAELFAGALLSLSQAARRLLARASSAQPAMRVCAIRLTMMKPDLFDLVDGYLFVN
jgi:hypothetical protein